MPTTIRLTPPGLAWLKKGHLWIYRDDFAAGAEPAASGEVVRVESSAGTFLAQGFYSGASRIALRLIRFTDEPVDRDFLGSLLVKARQRRGDAFSAETACRLVSAEGDLFPGLIVDHYAGRLVLQSLIPGVDRLMPLILELIEDLFSPLSVTLRCDLAARKLEGIPQFKELKKGEPPRAIEVREGPIKYLADLLDGHKTGAYLDQQTNRLGVGRWARGRGLDAFSYQGHFALHLAGGCDEVVALESSGPALDRLKLNCELNNIANVVPVKANVFEELTARAERGERFDIIVLDPPPFAKSKKDLVAARKGYRELNRRALQLLNPGGRLITYSCSYHLAPDLFLSILREAAADARRQVRLLEPQTQALDHPILLTVPESQYLKGFALEAGE